MDLAGTVSLWGGSTHRMESNACIRFRGKNVLEILEVFKVVALAVILQGWRMLKEGAELYFQSRETRQGIFKVIIRS